MTSVNEAIRGAALEPFVAWYARAHGRPGLTRALARLSEPERRTFDPSAQGLGISAAGWYPAPMIHRMLDGLLEGLTPPERARLASSGAEQTIADALNGYLGMAFRALVSPRVCAVVGPRLWHSFYSGGRVRIHARGPRCHVMDVALWPGHHAFLCEMNSAAGRAIYRAAGCPAVTTEHACCVARGDGACSYVIRW